MGIYEKYFLPKLLNMAMKAPAMKALRKRLVPLAEGKVLDAKVEESSGFANLDRASIAALKNCRIAAVNNVSGVNNVAGVTGDSKLDDKMTPESQVIDCSRGQF